MKASLAKAVKGGTERLQQLARKASERLGSPEPPLLCGEGVVTPPSSAMQGEPREAEGVGGTPGAAAAIATPGAAVTALDHGALLPLPPLGKELVEEEEEGEPLVQADQVLDSLLRHKARNAAVRREFLRVPQEAYTTMHEVKLLAATFNCNGRAPLPGLDLRPWLGGAKYADLVAVGLQEMVPLNATNVVIGAGVEAALEWDQLIRACINGGQTRAPARSVTAIAQADAGAQRQQQQPQVERQQQTAGAVVAAAHTLATTSLDAQKQGVESSTSDAYSTTTGNGSSSSSSSRSREAARAADEANDEAAAASTLEVPDPSAEFVQIASRQLVGVYLTVWVRRTLLPHVRGVQALSVGTGVLGVLGNKGAVAVRLRLFDSSLALVCSHLSSGEDSDSLHRRLYDYGEIVRRGYFGAEDDAVATAAVMPASLTGMAVQAAVDDSVAASVGGTAADGGSSTAAVGTPTPIAAAGEGSQGTYPWQDHGPVQRPGQWGSELHLLDSELLVWLGDLNFRLQGVEDAQARALIRGGRLAELLARDELGAVVRAGLAFEGFLEGPVRFAPTYKLRRGTSLYIGEAQESSSSLSSAASSRGGGGGKAEGEVDDDASSSTQGEGSTVRPPGKLEKVRTPAWTDRILFRELAPGAVRLMAYTSAPCDLSDHLPVYAAFILRPREYVREQVAATVEAARKVVDAREMAATPHCQLDPPMLNLGTLYYGRSRSLPVLLTATGGGGAAWQLAPVPGAAVACPPWLVLEPTFGLLHPGESTLLRLTACVTGGPHGGAQSVVVEAGGRLDAVLVLQVHSGNTMFLAVSGTYQPSCFGLSLETLVALSRPICQPWPKDGSTAPHSSGMVGAGVGMAPEDSADGVPIELRRLTALIEQTGEGLRTPGLFTTVVEMATSAALACPPDGRRNSSPTDTPEGSEQGAGEAQQDPGEQAACEAAAALPEGGTEHAGISATATAGWPTGAAATVHELRECLDTGTAFPPHAGPHEGAATLLAWLAALPQPLLPAAAARVCDVCEPAPGTAAALLDDALPPGPTRVVYEHVVSLFRAALAPANASANGLTSGLLAVLLAKLWFPALPSQPSRRAAAGSDNSATGPSAGADDHQVVETAQAADSVAEVQQRRVAFIQQLLEMGSRTE